MSPWIHVCCGVLLVAIGGVWAEYGRRQLQRQDEAAKESAKLKPPTFRERVENVYLTIGPSSTEYKFADLEKAHVPVDFGGYSPISLYIENKKLYADVTLFGSPELPAINIKRNEFHTPPPQWDINSNDTALEVVNEKKIPIFQLYYKNQSHTHISINGYFPQPGGRAASLMMEDGFIPVAAPDPNLPPEFLLKRIFRYPAWKYPGQFESSDALSEIK